MVKTNCNASIQESRSSRAKTRYRVSIRYKAFTLEEILLTKVEKNAVVHFLYVLSRAMKRDKGECPFYYKVEDVSTIIPGYCGEV